MYAYTYMMFTCHVIILFDHMSDYSMFSFHIISFEISYDQIRFLMFFENPLKIN